MDIEELREVKIPKAFEDDRRVKKLVKIFNDVLINVDGATLEGNLFDLVVFFCSIAELYFARGEGELKEKAVISSLSKTNIRPVGDFEQMIKLAIESGKVVKKTKAKAFWMYVKRAVKKKVKQLLD